MAAKHKCLAQMNKSSTGGKATKKYVRLSILKDQALSTEGVDHEIRFARYPLQRL
jgi:hypothetical protein